jgi:hypothetical protein
LPIRIVSTAGDPKEIKGANMDFVSEFWLYFKERKKFWLLPLLAAAVVFGGLIVLTQGSAVAPFIYTLF